MAALARQVADNTATILERIEGGHDVPWDRSIRGRLHVLEAERVSAHAASRALAEAQRERRLAAADRAEAERRRGRHLWRWVGAVIAVTAIVAPYVAEAITRL